MQSLQEIITEDGDRAVAELLGFSEVYMRHIRTGKRPASTAVLAKAVGVFGDRLDAKASLSRTSTAA